MSVTPPTEQGRRTRERIVAKASQLIAERGPAGTSLDDILVATRTSKSQLYHYFGDKHGLVEAVVDHDAAAVLGIQVETLAAVRGWEDLEGWADSMVAMNARRGSRGGCPIGTLAAALADADESLREMLSDAFLAWRMAIRSALETLQEQNLLAANADLDWLATVTLSAIEGGLLLAKTTRDSNQLRIALDGAIAQLRTSAPTAATRRRQRNA
jgi:AcrR family transcriptional regulator